MSTRQTRFSRLALWLCWAGAFPAPLSALVAPAAFWSADSRVVAVNTGPETLEVYDAAGNSLWHGSFTAPLHAVALSADGRRLAYAVAGQGVWVRDLAAGSASLAYATAAGQRVTLLSWSPDGSVLLLSMMELDKESKAWRTDIRPRLLALPAAGGAPRELKP